MQRAERSGGDTVTVHARLRETEEKYKTANDIAAFLFNYEGILVL